MVAVKSKKIDRKSKKDKQESREERLALLLEEVRLGKLVEITDFSTEAIKQLFLRS